MNLTELSAPFAPEAISWRAQNMKADGTSAMALAYIDARDVMARLDEVCGPANWQDSYVETIKGRIICTLSVRIDGEWISKSDGAGDTDVEGEKGAISDALKRCAVKWGVGRYLYDLGDTWAECEPMKDREGNLIKNAKGKPQFKKWTDGGKRALAAAAIKAGNAAGQPDTVAPPDPNALINDTQRQWLINHAEASVGVTELLRHYGKATIKDFTAGELTPARDWLKSQKVKDAA